MKMKQRYHSGFTLLELTIVMLVISLLVGGSLSIVSSNSRTEKIRDTRDRMDEVMEQVIRYQARHGSLPCPAVATTNMKTVATAGIATTGTPGTPGTCATLTAQTVALSSGGTYYFGGLPYYSLRIPPELAVDAWNRKIMYAVDANFIGAANTVAPASGFSADTAGRLAILTSADNPTVSSAGSGAGSYSSGAGRATLNDKITNDSTVVFTEGAIVVILSHGENGRGAYGITGAQIVSSSGTADENENIDEDSDNGFFLQALSYSEATGKFDDILMYRTRWQFADE